MEREDLAYYKVMIFLQKDQPQPTYFSTENSQKAVC